jgi:predicted RNA binding protein YcfA (HicA-like mRNA interferase family)
MPSVSGKALAKALERRGWVLMRINGSHHIFAKAGERARLSVPIHGNEPLKIGTLRTLLKAAGIAFDEV